MIFFLTYDLKNINPSEIYCVPGYPEQITVEKSVGVFWQALSFFFQDDKLEVHHESNDGVNDDQMYDPLNNKYIINITIDEYANLRDDTPLEISLSPCFLDQIYHVKKTVKLITLPLKIRFDPEGDIRATRNMKISRKLIGIFPPRFGMAHLKLSENSNIHGIEIKFSPSQITLGDPHSNMTINISDNVECKRHKLSIIGEYDNKTVNCSLDLIVENYGISGVVFNDTNANGNFDNNEIGLPNWSINLTRSSDNFSEEATTDKNGYYKITNLDPGIYILQEIVKTGWNPTKPKSGSDNATLTNSSITLNFGNSQGTFTISGIIFEDANSNGIRESNEKILQGWHIQLKGPNNRRTESNTDGFYEFKDL